MGYNVDYELPCDGIFFMSGHDNIKSFSINGIEPPWYREIRNCGHNSGFVAGALKGQRVKMITDAHRVIFIPIR